MPQKLPALLPAVTIFVPAFRLTANGSDALEKDSGCTRVVVRMLFCQAIPSLFVFSSPASSLLRTHIFTCEERKLCSADSSFALLLGGNEEGEIPRQSMSSCPPLKTPMALCESVPNVFSSVFFFSLPLSSLPSPFSSLPRCYSSLRLPFTSLPLNPPNYYFFHS